MAGSLKVWRATGAQALVVIVTLALLLGGGALAYTFPALTGRVVDQANIIPAGDRNALELKSAELEAKSGIQLVVATVNSLEGGDIEGYANQLFRTWKLGEAKNNNGVLLLVAPNEKRVRIEVGYGLEGTLTDALSKVIITNAITPRFKAGDFPGGITRGVDDIITVLTTDASEWEKRPSLRLDTPSEDNPDWIFITIICVIFFLLIVSRGFRQWLFSGLGSGSSSGGSSGSSWSSGSSSSSSSGGGFSGGGGSSGGGGASGSW